MPIPRRRLVAVTIAGFAAAAVTVAAVVITLPAYAGPTPEPSPSPSESSPTSQPSPSDSSPTANPSPSGPTSTSTESPGPTSSPSGPPTSSPPAPIPNSGTITGQVTDAGRPVVGATVSAQPAGPGGVLVPPATTDANGVFTITNVRAGTYRIQFRVPTGTFTTRDWYSPSSPSPGNAVVYTVNADQVLTLNEAMPAYGALTGVLTRTDGSPVSGAGVFGIGPQVLISATTDASGRYIIPFAWVGTYRLQFRPPLAPTQYAHGKLNVTEADTFAVAVGQTTTVDEVLVPVGTIRGRVTGQGQPVAFAMVSIFTPQGTGVTGVVTGADGTYRVQVAEGTYVVQFRLPNGVVQYAHQQSTLATADRFTVVAGQDTVVNEQVVVASTIRGTVRNADGTPAGLTSVTISGDGRTYFAPPGPAGTWQASVLPGTYKVMFQTALGIQFAFGKSTPETADPIVVGENATVVVDETLVPTGTLTVTATDHKTGTPVASFCASAGLGGSTCTTTGAVTLTRLPGLFSVLVDDPDHVYLSEHFQAEIKSGQDTPVAVVLSKAATLTTVIKDAASGAPVASACLQLVQTLRPFTLGGSPNACSDANGAVTIRGLSAGLVNGFVDIRDGTHGMQWVGLNRGTGAQAFARPIIITEGATVTLPTIKLDGLGSITGVVTDGATGQLLPNTYVSLSTANAGAGPSGIFTNTDASGRYTLSGLGPYNWTLFFGRAPYAAVFSGGTGDRFLARGVPVRVGQTATFDQAMRVGTTLTGTVTHPFPGFVRVTLIHALSADELGASDIQGTGPYTFHVAGPLLVKLMVNDRWVGGEDFLHAQVFLVDPDGTTTADIAV